ncbi:MAG: hypothetical protein EBS84_04955 [Proteobacteria bacterium]|nr:hypothetical protein [Pseudomonadota bacterium]
MRTAKASVLEAFNAPLRLHTYEVPSPVEPGAVLVRTEMAGIPSWARALRRIGPVSRSRSVIA